MFRFVCKEILIRQTSSTSISRASLTTTRPHVCYLQTQSLKSKSESEKSLITVSYLINSCGLSLESADSASKKINICSLKVTEKADSVLELFRAHGFTDTQITKLVTKSPNILQSNPDQILKPKIEYFKSLGFPTHPLTVLITKQPQLLTRSLENVIVPFCNYIRTLVVTENNLISALKNYSRLLKYNLEIVRANISILRNHGVPEPNICRWIISYSETLTVNQDRIEVAIAKARQLEFDPTDGKFITAVVTLASCSEMILKQKMEAYKSFDLSEEDIILAIKLDPMFMAPSEKKIRKLMHFFVTNLEWKPSVVCKFPKLTRVSLEKSIIPKCSVLQLLMSKGLLVKEDINIPSVLARSGNYFLKRFVTKYQDEIPEVVEAHQDANPRTWPQLLGKPANVAKAIIERDVPGVAVILRTSDNYGIFDFCCNRVWLYVDNDARHTVNAVPKIG